MIRSILELWLNISHTDKIFDSVDLFKIHHILYLHHYKCPGFHYVRARPIFVIDDYQEGWGKHYFISDSKTKTSYAPVCL